MSGHSEAEIAKHVRIYVTVFVALMALTVITVGIYYIHLPTRIAIGLALAVATIKASLVACYFMHLISEKKLIRWVLALTVLFFLFMLVGPILTEQDPITIGASMLLSV